MSKLKENVLWKWDDPNAKVNRKKFLAHPRVKVFVTHGGFLGGTEAIYYGKPLVTIPIFGDQKLNAARSAMIGYGVRIDLNNLTESSLCWGLNEVINNNKYTEKVKRLSSKFRDKPQHPVDLAVFYVEYVMRHKGAILQSSPSYLNFIELNNLDVCVILVTILFVTLYISYFLIKKLLQICFGVSQEKKKVKNIE